jgi:hypothetical protein
LVDNDDGFLYFLGAEKLSVSLLVNYMVKLYNFTEVQNRFNLILKCIGFNLHDSYNSAVNLTEGI